MAKTATVCARIEPRLKKDVEAVFESLGLSTTEAINLFYRQVSMRRDLPFPARKPNAETREAMRQILTGEGLIECDGVKGMIAECERDDA